MDVFGIHLPNTDPEAVLALFVVLFFLGVIVPGWQMRKWEKHAERSAGQVDQLIESLEPMVKVVKLLKDRLEREDAEAREAAERRRRRNGGQS